MLGYRRPAIAPVVFFDAAGNKIPYGSRWHNGSPPENSYSVTSNLERFRPIHSVADALVGWLVAAYDVQVDQTAAVTSDLLQPRNDVTRAVRITPSSQDAAPLTFVSTSFPSVIVHAGALQDFLFPVCGCDACDESWEAAADDLEWAVFTIVRGGYSERIDLDDELGVHYSLDEPGVGSRSGRTRVDGYSMERLERAQAAVPSGSWAAWRLRSGGA
jgi:hypothetical protein